MTTAHAINMTTRTLLTEIDFHNPAGTLLTGSYAEVHLKIPSEVPTYLDSCQYPDFPLRRDCRSVW